MHLRHGPVTTPVFMPVGTKGTLKGLTPMDVTHSEALDNRIILANTYHLALQPGTELIRDAGTEGGLHEFMGWDRNILTDSGGFQMVSLLKLAEITEEGVTFENPFGDANNGDDDDDIAEENGGMHRDDDAAERRKRPRSPVPASETSKSQRMLLRPEDSIHHQNNIGSDIMMALDDVVSSVADDPARFRIATYRTVRSWFCHDVHLPEVLPGFMCARRYLISSPSIYIYSVALAGQVFSRPSTPGRTKLIPHSAGGARYESRRPARHLPRGVPAARRQSPGIRHRRIGGGGIEGRLLEGRRSLLPGIARW